MIPRIEDLPGSSPSAETSAGATASSGRGRIVLSLGLLLATGALLGLSTNLAKVAGNIGLAPLPFLTWSALGAAVLLLVLAAARRALPPLTARTTEYAFLSALVSVAAPNLLFFSAVPHVGAGFVALAISLPPLLTYVGALALRMERFSPARALGVVLALAGVAAIAIPKLNAPDAPVGWIAAALVGPVFLAIGNLYRSRRWPPGARPDGLAPAMLGAAAAMLIAFSAMPGQTLAMSGGAATALLIAAQAVTFTLQYLLFFMLQKLAGPVFLSLLGAVGAIVGVPIAVLLLGEAPPQGLVLGGVLIALGIALLLGGRMPAKS